MEEAEAKQMELVCQRQEALAQKLKFKLVADKDSKGDEAPKAVDREKANAAAAGRGCPEIPPPLCWGYKAKKELYIWCTDCGCYPAWVRYNQQTGEAKCGVEGKCNHFMETTYVEQMQSALRAAGW